MENNAYTVECDLSEENYVVHEPAVNSIMPGISLYAIASRLLESNMTI